MGVILLVLAFTIGLASICGRKAYDALAELDKAIDDAFNQRSK